MKLESIQEHIALAREMEKHSIKIVQITDIIYSALCAGNKILSAGNGGSAADAQHFTTELVGRYKIEKKGFFAIALTTNSSILTAVSNDYGYHEVFARQIEALGKKGDILLLISTSGNSKNLIKAAEKAKMNGIQIIGLLGKEGGKLKNMCNLEITVPSDNTPRIQEMHALILHIICETIENKIMNE